MLPIRLVTIALLLTIPTIATAQQPGGPPPGAEAQTPEQRERLEARVRERMGQMIRTQLNLSDDQMRRLQASNQRFERQRRLLVEQERDVRMGLRDEMISGDTTRGPQVAALLDRMLQVQRQRLDLLEAEQKELAGFLTPLQRARYFGLEEQLRRRVEEMRQGGGVRQEPPMGRPGMQGRPGGQGRPGARRPPAGLDP